MALKSLDSSANALKYDDVEVIRSAGLPCSTIRPACTTIIKSLSAIVLRRCAMVIVVALRSAFDVLIVF